jgi:hypothetical protein
MSACSSAAFDTAYAAASSGDTIAFPAGSCSVSMTKTIAKQNLTIMGSGTSNTIVTGGFSGTTPNVNGLRITNMRINSGPTLDIGGSSTASGIRVDHCYLYNQNYFFSFGPNVTNCVIDHNTFDTSSGSGIYVWGTVPRSSPGFPYALGMASGGAGLYVEDNVWINVSSASHLTCQSRGGSRFVFRYNHVTVYAWDPFDAHDNYEGSSESGSATWEYYNNIIQADHGIRMFHMRGGQGVIYNNYVNGTGSDIDINSYALCYSECVKGTPGYCSWVPQSIYIWGNKQNCGSLASCDPNNSALCCTGGSTWSGAATCSGGGGNQQLVQGVDYFNYAMPGYIPYTYPHPLTNSEILPLPPRNLMIGPQ